jgi:BirA family biotin operon repressor/biotin-[acetyl-CoA-carboxylase] ligase
VKLVNFFFVETFRERLVSLGDGTSREVLLLDEVDSTSTELKRRIKQGAMPGTIAVAHRQTQGRGRLGRVWHSSPLGNLYLSILMETGAPTNETVPLLPLAAGIAAHEAATEVGAYCHLKWPNDVLVSGKKLAGILCEAVMMSKDRAQVIVGLGVNIPDAPFPPEIAHTAVSLNTVLKKEIDISFLAAGFVSSLESWNLRITKGDRAALIQEWRKRAEPFGRGVKVGDVTGKTVDLASDGRLIVLDDHGQEHLIAGGIVESVEFDPNP